MILIACSAVLYLLLAWGWLLPPSFNLACSAGYYPKWFLVACVPVLAGACLVIMPIVLADGLYLFARGRITASDLYHVEF